MIKIQIYEYTEEWYFEFFVKWSNLCVCVLQWRTLKWMMAQQINRISWVKGWWAFWERRTWSPGRKRNAVDAAETDTAWTNWNSSWGDWMFSYMRIYYTCTHILIYAISESIIELQEFVIMRVHNCPLLAIVCYWDYSFILYSKLSKIAFVYLFFMKKLM